MNISSYAQAAKAIKKELKNAFPGVKFLVRSDSFAGGDAVRINYTDGVIVDEVSKIVKKYEYGDFDCMQDLFVANNVRVDIPQVKYVQISWNISDEVILKACSNYSKHFAIEFSGDPYAYSENIKNFTMVHDNFYQAIRHLIRNNEIIGIDGELLFNRDALLERTNEY